MMRRAGANLLLDRKAIEIVGKVERTRVTLSDSFTWFGFSCPACAACDAKGIRCFT